MRWRSDVECGAWLHGRVGEEWATVAGVAGSGFERYARVLHPIAAHRVDWAVVDAWGSPLIEEVSWPWSEVARRNGKTMHPLVQWVRITDDERLLEFSDGWQAGQSRAGWFDPELMASLTSSLRLHTTTADDITVGIWNGWGIPQLMAIFAPPGEEASNASERQALWVEEERRRADAYSAEYLRARQHGPFLSLPGREYVLLTTSLTELADPRWGVDAGLGWGAGFAREPSPQLVWPEDRAWVVATEVDWDSTIIAGTSALIEAVLADPRFESFEVDDGDDLSWQGDTIN